MTKIQNDKLIIIAEKPSPSKELDLFDQRGISRMNAELPNIKAIPQGIICNVSFTGQQ